eukprot:TRINITY_DN1829_c0_g1_i1.p2 TRINITY_DN1829_c0_g1~~TRINITY_DN1829_c0_g1_i1.p2  ORF type:complete len:189 (+),score=57.46 TRINITY_DN1829_c0_g1_i1:1042-1608(+)
MDYIPTITKVVGVVKEGIKAISSLFEDEEIVIHRNTGRGEKELEVENQRKIEHQEEKLLEMQLENEKEIESKLAGLDKKTKKYEVMKQRAREETFQKGLQVQEEINEMKKNARQNVTDIQQLIRQLENRDNVIHSLNSTLEEQEMSMWLDGDTRDLWLEDEELRQEAIDKGYVVYNENRPYLWTIESS